jgi:hypothetical protein
MGRLFGQSIDQDVVKQLEQREAILGRNGIRSTQDLRFLTQKSAWIRMISGVNVLDQEGSFTNQAAKSLILSGGALKIVPTENPSTSSPYSGYKAAKVNNLTLAKNGSTNFSSTERGRYSRTENLGVRPEPGITSFNITHKGRYGAVRAAEVGFTVWSREDLDAVQDLYLRPGMSLIVEWGNSIYVDNEGSIEEMSLPDGFDSFFFDNKTSKIIDIINKHRIKTDYNYDGFIGLVSNFSWNFREDGGYDCTVSIISRGAIIESLTVKKPTPIPANTVPNGNQELDLKITRYKKSILHAFTQLVQDTVNFEPEINEITLDKLRNPIIPSQERQSQNLNIPTESNSNSEQKTLIDIVGLLNNVLSNEEKDFTIAGFKIDNFTGGEVQIYAPLRTVLGLINASFTTTSPNGEKIVKFNTSKKDINTYKTFLGHFSLNPFNCILPKDVSNVVTGTVKTLNIKGKFKSFFGLEITEKDQSNELKSINVAPKSSFGGTYPVTNTITKAVEGSNDILDIYVNLNLVVDILDKHYYKQDEEQRANVLDFVTELLKKINYSLGNINSFDIHYDELSNSYSVVDREKIIQEVFEDDADKNKNVSRINLTGLKSTVSNVSIQTKITSELSAQIAISAQGSRYLNGDTNLPFVDWNRDIRDRFKSVFQTDNGRESSGNVSTEDETVDTSEQFINDILAAYNELNNARLLSRSSTNENNEFDRLIPRGIVYFKELYYKQTLKKGTNETRNPILEEIPEIGEEGLIPLDLEFTLDGIAGINIAQIFKVGDQDNPSNILPSKYDRYGFIVTAVDHTLENSKWLTTVRGITFKIP